MDSANKPSLTTTTTEQSDGKLSPCRILWSPCGTGVYFRGHKSTFYLDFFTNGGSTVYSEACSGPAVFVISW